MECVIGVMKHVNTALALLTFNVFSATMINYFCIEDNAIDTHAQPIHILLLYKLNNVKIVHGDAIHAILQQLAHNAMEDII